MTVRHAYFRPGDDVPWCIYDSMDSVMEQARKFNDDFPVTAPVTLGDMQLPTVKDINGWVLNWFRMNNPYWEKGFEKYVSRMEKYIEREVAILAGRLESWNKDNPGYVCLLYTSPSPRDLSTSRMPSSA